MDPEPGWQRATELLMTSSDVWTSPEFVREFPQGLDYVASAIVHTIGTDGIDWIETVTDLESPKAQVAVFAGELLVHVVLTAHGFGFEVRKLRVTLLRATSTPRSSDDASPFTFLATLDGLDLHFPWDPANHKQDDRLEEQFHRLLAVLRDS